MTNEELDRLVRTASIDELKRMGLPARRCGMPSEEVAKGYVPFNERPARERREAAARRGREETLRRKRKTAETAAAPRPVQIRSPAKRPARKPKPVRRAVIDPAVQKRDAEVIRLYTTERKTTYQIAALLGINPRTATRILAQHGIERRGKAGRVYARANAERDTEWARRRAAGESIKSIARSSGRADGTVYWALKALEQRKKEEKHD